MLEEAAVKSQALGKCFVDAAATVGAELIDLADVLRYSDEDPIHLDADGHRILAEALLPYVRRLGHAA